MFPDERYDLRTYATYMNDEEKKSVSMELDREYTKRHTITYASGLQC